MQDGKSHGHVTTKCMNRQKAQSDFHITAGKRQLRQLRKFLGCNLY